MSQAVALVLPDDEKFKQIDLAWVKSLDIEQTLKHINEDMEAIEKHGIRLGVLILHAQELGHDVGSILRRPIIRAARNLALGFLAVEAFSAYHANTDVLHRLVDLPKEKQIELVNIGTVPVCEIIGKETTHRNKDIAKLTPKEAELVFSKHEHKVRSVEEQAQIISANILEERMKKRKARISHDPKTFLIDAENASSEQLKAYMKKNGL